MTYSVDPILNKLGSWTRFHIGFMALASTIVMRFSWPIFGVTFAAVVPDYHCVDPYYSALQANETNTRCQVEDINGTVTMCTKWAYDMEPGSSIVMDWELVCGRSYLIPAELSIYQICSMVGSVVFATVSDVIGRSSALLFGAVVQFILCVIMIFSTDMLMYTIIHACMGVFNPLAYGASMVIVCEWFPADNRSIPPISLQLTWGVGMCINALFAYFTRSSWRGLMLFFAIPAGLVLPLIYFFLPESLHFLNGKQYYGKLVRTAERAARIAKVDLGDTLDDFKILNKEKQENKRLIVEEQKEPAKEGGNMLNAIWNTWFKDCLFSFYSITIWCQWFVLAVGYMVLTFGSVDLPGDVYINYMLSGLIEMPGNILVLFLSMRFGRLTILFYMYLFTFFALASTYWLNTGIIQTVVVTVAKGAISGAYVMQIIYGTEIFPTPVRNAAIGVSQFFETAGAAVSPFIVDYMRRESSGDSTYIIIGFGFLAIAIATLWLRETYEQPLPNTSKAMRDLPSNGIISWVCGCCTEKKSQVEDIVELKETDF